MLAFEALVSRLLPLLRESPVTAGCLVVCVVLFLGTTRPGQTAGQRVQLLDRWGAVVDRPVSPANNPDVVVLRAPSALWEAELWRIPVCAFHHVDFWHLLMNCLSAAYLGRILERRWGTRRMLLFLPLAATIPLIPEFALGNYVLGFSGVIAAMFGALCVLRHVDDSLLDELPDEAVYLGGAMLAAGVIFTWVDLMPVANMAHMIGFFWGALAASVETGLPWGKRRARLVRFATVAAFAGLLWFVVHPIWDGTYHWYQALRTNDGERRLAELQRAVALDPHVVGAWRFLAGEEWRRGNRLDAWKTLLLGLSHNPTDADLLWRSRIAWRELIISPGRTAAEQVIAEVFGQQAANWTDQLRGGISEIWEDPARMVAEIDPVEAFPLDRPVDLRLPELPGDEPAPRRIPPEGDAVEGRSM
jgi:membrane associated rhomboid family serine protease